MAKLNTYQQPAYDGGLNNSSSPRVIKYNEAARIENWDITFQGQLRRRSGITQVGNMLTSITGLAAYTRTTGLKDIVCMDGTTLRYLNSATFDALDTGFTAGNPFSFSIVPINDRLYIANEDNTLHYWNRAAVTTNSCLTDLGSSVPHGNILRWHKNHMFTLNNVKIGSTVYPNRMYWSVLGDPDTYDTTNDFIEAPGNGRLITAMDLGDSLVILKERGIIYLDGWGDTDWRITASASNVSNLDENIGTVSPYGAVRVGNEIWFMDDEANIRRITRTDFDAFRRDIISTKVRGTLDNINSNRLNQVVAWSHDDKVYFSMPMGSDSENSTVLVFDITASKRTGEEAWTTYTGWSMNHFVSYPTNDQYELYAADGTKVYIHSGTNDGGTAIEAVWDGKQDEYKYPERYKRYKFGYVTGVAGTETDVNIYSSIDSSAFSKMGTLEMAITGSMLGPTSTDTLGPTGNFVLGGAQDTEEKFYYQDGGAGVTGKRIQHSIRHTDVDAQPTVNTFTSHYKLRSLR